MEELKEISTNTLVVAPEAQNGLFTLPNDVLTYILSSFTPKQLLNFVLSCKAAQSVVASEQFNKYWLRRLQDLNHFQGNAITNYFRFEFYYRLFWQRLDQIFCEATHIEQKQLLIKDFGPEVAMLVEHYNVKNHSKRIPVKCLKNNIEDQFILRPIGVIITIDNPTYLHRLLTQQPSLITSLRLCELDLFERLLTIACHFDLRDMMIYLLNLNSRLIQFLSHFDEYTYIRKSLEQNSIINPNGKHRLRALNNDDSILQDRCRKNDIAMVKLLLSHPRISVNDQNLIMIAFENRHFELFALLVQDPRIQLPPLTELLTTIIEENRPKLIRPLVERIGICPEYTAAVLKCARERQIQYFTLFLDACIDPNFHMTYSFSTSLKPLIDGLLEVGYMPLLKILFAKKCGIDQQNLHMIAIELERRHQGMAMEFFSATHVDYSLIRTNSGNNILHQCVAEGFDYLLRTLLKLEKTRELISMTNENGQTPLALACIHHNITAIEVLFDAQEIKFHMNCLIDNISLAQKLIESGMLFRHPELILNNQLNESYRDPLGKSYLHLLCEQIPFPEQAIMYYIYKQPFLIATLPEKTLIDCFHRCSSILAKDLIMLGNHVPPVKLNHELQQCVKLKKAVLKCLSPWNFKKLTALSQKHATDHDFKILIEILITEDPHPRHLTQAQRQSLKSLIKVEVKHVNHYSDSDNDSDSEQPISYNN